MKLRHEVAPAHDYRKGGDDCAYYIEHADFGAHTVAVVALDRNGKHRLATRDALEPAHGLLARLGRLP